MTEPYGAITTDTHGTYGDIKYTWDTHGMMRFVYYGQLYIKYFPTLDLALDYMKWVIEE